MLSVNLSTEKKASSINEDSKIYGSFAEIGAGQETARHFFKAGYASHTIAKSISAYDMSVSDSIYGKKTRYVSRQRIDQMLDHEYELLKKRIQNTKCFFSFSNTVTIAPRNSKKVSHGWLGLKFQLQPKKAPNEIIIHVKMKDGLRVQQQEALGVLGVNLIYASFYKNKSENLFIETLMDDLNNQRVEIDFIDIKGKDLKHLKKEFLNLILVQKELTGCCLFLPQNKIDLITDNYFEKNILVQRGTFRPITKTNIEIMKKSLKHLKLKKSFQAKPTVSLFEMSLKNSTYKNLSDIVDCASLITSCNYPVIVSNFSFDYEVKDLIRSFTSGHIAMVIGGANLKDLFNLSYYAKYKVNILKALGKLFDNKVKMLIYPYKTEKICINLASFFPDKKIKGLFDFLKDNKYIEDLANCDKVDTSTLSKDVRKAITQKKNWSNFVPKVVENKIKKQKLFGYK